MLHINMYFYALHVIFRPCLSSYGYINLIPMQNCAYFRRLLHTFSCFSIPLVVSLPTIIDLEFHFQLKMPYPHKMFNLRECMVLGIQV